MVKAGGDFILAMIWFFNSIIDMFNDRKYCKWSTDGWKTPKDWSYNLICIDMCLQLVVKPMFSWSLPPEM